jgi:hypothetical protein
LKAAIVHKYVGRAGGGGDIDLTRTPLFTKRKLAKEVVGCTQLGKTQRNIGLLCGVLKMLSYSF